MQFKPQPQRPAARGLRDQTVRLKLETAVQLVTEQQPLKVLDQQHNQDNYSIFLPPIIFSYSTPLLTLSSLIQPRNSGNTI